MSTELIDDGGPAFPWRPIPGMSLRDWFAGMAMQAMIAGEDAEMRARAVPDGTGGRTGFDDHPYDTETTYASRTSVDAYIVADAMIAEKRRTEGGGA